MTCGGKMRHRGYCLALTLAVLGSGFFAVGSAQCITLCDGGNSTHGNSPGGMCNRTEGSCAPFSNATFDSFLSCAGLRRINNTQEHINGLKEMMDVAFQFYSDSFMSLSRDLQPILELIKGLSFNASKPRFHDVNFTRVWFQLKLRPRLASVTESLLACLSTSDLTCQTYQALVNELDMNILSMDPQRQRIVYTSFMRRFLERNDTAGCLAHENSSEQWLMRNFGSFSTLVDYEDFFALNVNFSGLSVLALLSPEQKAELVLHPGNGDLDNGTISLVFQSLLGPLINNAHLNQSMYNATMMSNMAAGNATGPHELDRTLNDFLSFLRPLGSFIKTLVGSIQVRNVSSERQHVLAQAVVNWILAELAGHISPNFTLTNETIPSQTPSLSNFNITSLKDWFQHVVLPALNRFQLNNQTQIPHDLTAVFNQVFSLNPPMGSNSSMYSMVGPMDVCHIGNNDDMCSVSHAAENLAVVLRCVPHSNLSLTGENLKLLVTELSKILTGPHTMMNDSSGWPNLTDLFGQLPTDGFSAENLGDENFITFWFLIRLRPLLPSVSEEYLSCLSTRDFSCQAYQALVMGLSDHISSMDEMRQKLVYTRFIHPFLTQHRYSDMMGCPSNGSLDSIKRHFGRFSIFAPLQHFFDVQRNFSALEALPALSPKQLAELVLMPHTPTPQRDDIINRVFDHLHNDTRLRDFLHELQMLIRGTSLECESFTRIFNRLDRAATSAPSDLGPVIRDTQDSVMDAAPPGCNVVPFKFGCSTTPQVNESHICAGVNTTNLENYIAGTNMTLMLCNFTIQHYACLPQRTQLKPEQLSEILQCKLSGNLTYPQKIWKLFFTKYSAILDEALHRFSNMSYQPSGPSISLVLDVFGEVVIDQFSQHDLRSPNHTRKWFLTNLRPFLPQASREFLSCLSTKNFTCGTYQILVEALGRQPANPNPANSAMDRQRQLLIYTNFIEPFLRRNDTEDPNCFNNSNNSTDWLKKYFGPFVGFAPLEELKRLHGNFSVVDVLPMLSPVQLGEVASTPGQLRNPGDVHMILIHVLPRDLGEFFDIVSPAVEGLHLPVDVRQVLLQQVFDNANLPDPSIKDPEVLVWLGQRLRPLLPNLTEEHVAPLFNIVRHRGCNISQETVALLNSILPSLSNGTQAAVQHQIIMSLRESTPLRCYRNNSFFMFLRQSFLNFTFPKLTNFLSLIPPQRESELLNTIHPSELGTFLRKPEVVDNKTKLCTIFRNYKKTPEFLETENLPDDVKRPVLPCVWPLALATDDKAEVDRWFDNRLSNYLKFLNRALLQSSDTLNASCLPFRRLVSLLGSNLTFNGSAITQDDAYSTIKTYLNTGSSAAPKCYSPTDPNLNSTAWFLNYIGVFITFVTVEDFDTFGSESTLQLFAVNPVNIKLFNFAGAPQNLTKRFTELIFLQNSNFLPLQLPPHLQCFVPASAYSKLNESESVVVLGNLNQSCTNVDSEISSALASNIQIVDLGSITALGPQVTSLTTGQITKAPPSVILQSLSNLSSVSGWNLGQSLFIIQILITQNFQINNSDSLINLGSLVGGLPTQTLIAIPAQQVLTTSTNPKFVTNMLTAPTIVQQIYVNKIITVDMKPTELIVNVPDEMATEIPRNLLNFPTTGNQTLTALNINKKKWKPQQAVLFFDTVANGLDEPDDLSEYVLQGFTCSRVQTFKKTKTQRLIRACRRRDGRRKVVLKETQLTCMWNNIKGESPQDFVNYPSDMLLYYSYTNIQQTNCRSYFIETGRADFSVLSSTLDGRKVDLLNNAKKCLNIKGTQLSRDNLEVLGNMACTLDENYIQSSDSYILEKLKNCNDFSDQQITAMETVICSGNTTYGNPSTWTEKTLEQLDILPLYLTENFWKHISTRNKSTFLKKFMKRLRTNKTMKRKLKKLFKECTMSLRSKRSTVNACPDSLGNITQVTISNDAFPFGYDNTTFNHCLSAQVVMDNLASLTEKVDDDDMQKVILEKLHQAYPKGLSDQQVQVLGSVSRVASMEQINKWNITTVDTLAALMDNGNGEWDSAKAKVIFTKFLSAGNSLGASALNSIGGPNLCALDLSVLQGIRNDSLRDADALEITSCSSAHKKAFFAVAETAFPINFAQTRATADQLTSYQLIQTYLGGANITYIRSLSRVNISMDINTFIGLDSAVVQALSVSEVSGLLGSNLNDLKTFENNTVVQNWVSKQLQSELDKLGISLTGGRVDSNTTPMTTNTATTIPNTTSGQSRGTYPVPLLFLFGLLFIVVQM
ncbi:uncharacterized protein mslna [Oncorhynchus kisutch]|nr:uncharacterized protein LOC109898459 [Oncorhynchus kisutch]